MSDSAEELGKITRLKVLVEYVDKDSQRKEVLCLDWQQDNNHDLQVSFSQSRPVNIIRDATGAVTEMEKSYKITFNLKAERTEK